MSAAGDAALVWPDLFLLGMLCFALAHLFFIRSLPSVGFLGPKPWVSLTVATMLYFLSFIIWLLFLRPGLNDPLLGVGVPVYISFLATSAWRSAVCGKWIMF